MNPNVEVSIGVTSDMLAARHTASEPSKSARVKLPPESPLHGERDSCGSQDKRFISQRIGDVGLVEHRSACVTPKRKTNKQIILSMALNFLNFYYHST
jgi:hypothetical protein